MVLTNARSKLPPCVYSLSLLSPNHLLFYVNTVCCCCSNAYYHHHQPWASEPSVKQALFEWIQQDALSIHLAAWAATVWLMGRKLIQQHIVGMEMVCAPEGVLKTYNQDGKALP